MKDHDWRATCTQLMRNRLTRDAAGRMREPAALGWKLENGHVTAAEVAAWCTSRSGPAARNGGLPDEVVWLRSAPLRELLREYRKVLDTRRDARPDRAPGRPMTIVRSDVQR